MVGGGCSPIPAGGGWLGMLAVRSGWRRSAMEGGGPAGGGPLGGWASGLWVVGDVFGCE